MFDEFNSHAIRVVIISQEEAKRSGYHAAGTEQILYGLVSEPNGIAGKILRMYITARKIREHINGYCNNITTFLPTVEDTVPGRELPFTPRAKQLLESAYKEARIMNADYVGTEHILIALLQVNKSLYLDELTGEDITACFAYRILEYFGIPKEQLRIDLFKAISRREENNKKLPSEYNEIRQNLGLELDDDGNKIDGTTNPFEDYFDNQFKSFQPYPDNAYEEEMYEEMYENDGEEDEQTNEEQTKILEEYWDQKDRQRQEESELMDEEEKRLNEEQEQFEFFADLVGDEDHHSTSRRQTSYISEYTKNISEKARYGLLDPVVGREEEIKRVIQILCRRTKNNPILIGEPGVGKTAIAEGLALRIAEEDVPEILLEKEVISLDLGMLLAGTKYRGEFEDRLKNIIEEAGNHGNTILVIDEVHTLVGAGAAEGAMDAANLLKPALARGEIQCIGATTINEYRQHIEKDAALERRFQPVNVEEPNFEDTCKILKGLRPRYEKHHGLKISDGAINAAVKLASQYIQDRFLPDKAIDLMDEAGSKVRLGTYKVPLYLTSIRQALNNAIEKKLDAIRRDKYDEAGEAYLDELAARAELQRVSYQMAHLTEKQKNLIAEEKREMDQESIYQQRQEISSCLEYETDKEIREHIYHDIKLLNLQIQELRYKSTEQLLSEAVASNPNLLDNEALFTSNNELTSDSVIDSNHQKESEKEKDEGVEPDKVEVLEEDVAEVVAAWTGIPTTKVSQSEYENLLNLENVLHKRVIGQNQAVHAVSQAMRRSRVGLKNPNRPIASLIFCGPTGVGKTELTKTMVTHIYGSEKSLVRLDMSEYMEKHTVAKMIGSPPGYVGYTEGGQLTEAVRRRPFSLILFDELEKAHPDILNILLQILEDGRLTDSTGRVVSFKNTLLVMTSNVGSGLILKESVRVNDEFKFKEQEIDEEVQRKVENAEYFSDPDEIENFKEQIKKETDDRKLKFQQEKYTRLQNSLLKHLKESFRPEFLNRIDEIIVFQELTENELNLIADIMIGDLKKRSAESGCQIEVDEKAKTEIVKNSYDPEFGARPLRRAITKYLEDPIAEHILKNTSFKDEGPSNLILHVQAEKIKIRSKNKGEQEQTQLIFTTSSDGNEFKTTKIIEPKIKEFEEGSSEKSKSVNNIEPSDFVTST